MPIYEYQCQKCGTFEVTQRITDDPLQRCPKCRRKVSKLISQTSFQLKGSGWYVTDYAGKGAKADADSGGAGTPDAASTDSSKAKSEPSPDKKPAGKKTGGDGGSKKASASAA